MAFFLEEFQVFFDKLLSCNHQFNRTLSFKKIYQIIPGAYPAFFVSRLAGIQCLLNDILSWLLRVLPLCASSLVFLVSLLLGEEPAVFLWLSLFPSFWYRF